ncbi:hypothetical protein, partial [[Clostridium] symbiosum]|uniref:hypothetical protein n=2 Tax=Clostridium symbiosum TaxID=1512 RepID=UPI0034A3D58B
KTAPRRIALRRQGKIGRAGFHIWNIVTSVRINFHKVVDMERAGAIINDGADEKKYTYEQTERECGIPDYAG